MGATASEYAAFKRMAADRCRADGAYPDSQGPIYIVSERLTNAEGFSGDALVERGSNVTARSDGRTAEFLLAADTDNVFVRRRGDRTFKVNPSDYNLTVTKH